MVRIRKYIIGCVVVLCVNLSFAQEMLSIQDVKFLLEANNYDLELAKQNIASANVLTSKYNRGYRPTLGINGGVNYSLNSTKSVFNFNFPDLNVNNFQSIGANLAANANYLLYDGGQRKLRNEQNEINVDAAYLQVDLLKQRLYFNAVQLYFAIVQARYNLDVLNESLEISKYRLKRAETYFEFGSSNRVDVLNAEVDVSRDSLNVISLLNDIENLKWQLNQLTLKENTDYSIDTSFVLFYQLSKFETLKIELLTGNKELAALEKNIDLVNYDLAIAEKVNAPQINANGNYSFTYQKNDSKGQLDFNRNRGLNLGLTANYNILDGGQQKVQEQLATIEQRTANINLKNAENNLVIQLQNVWNNYQNSLLVLEIEKQNITTNKVNFELVKNLFENGRQSSVEFRQAQLNLLNAQFQYYNARTQAKLNELELDFLLGK